MLTKRPADRQRLFPSLKVLGGCSDLSWLSRIDLLKSVFQGGDDLQNFSVCDHRSGKDRISGGRLRPLQGEVPTTGTAIFPLRYDGRDLFFGNTGAF
jgi:hypothetical protein